MFVNDQAAFEERVKAVMARSNLAGVRG